MLKSLVIPGVRMVEDKPVAKREGAFRIFAAPLFFLAIALLLGGGWLGPTGAGLTWLVRRGGVLAA